MNIPFVGPAYTERSPNLNAQTCINLYPALGGPDARAVTALYGTPGYTVFADLTSSQVRGLHVFGGELYYVRGAEFGKLSSSGAKTVIGSIASSSGRVSMADNGTAMLIVDGASKGYLYTGGVLSAITDIGMPNANRCCFLDGYFLFDDPSVNGRFMVSTAYASDPTNLVSPMDYATAEAEPDALICLAAHNGHLWLLGEATTEIWYDSGDVFPFTRMGGGRMERGCAARWSVAGSGDALLWLSTDRRGRVQVVMGSEGGINPVSTPAIEFEIGQYQAVSDAAAYVYHQEGHTFYVITFPTAGKTWVYDVTTNLWHRRAAWDSVAGAWLRHRGDVYAYAYGKHLLGDYANGRIYSLSLDAYTEDTGVLRRERTAPVIHADGKRLFFASLTLEMETGVGTVAVTNPQVMLDWSDDGGHTFSGDMWGALGAGPGQGGDYKKRVRFTRLGSSRQRNFRVTMSDPVKCVLIGATIEAEAGAS